jgi:hypothetical protein
LNPSNTISSILIFIGGIDLAGLLGSFWIDEDFFGVLGNMAGIWLRLFQVWNWFED